MLPSVEQINTQWKQRPFCYYYFPPLSLHADTRMCSHIALFSQTITRAAVTYKRNRLMDQWAEREARQQTASVSRIWAAHRHADGGGRLVYAEESGGGGGGGGVYIALTFSVDPGLSRSSSLHKTTPSFREVCRNASGSEMVFFGDSSTPSVINHVTVCSAEFMSSHNRSYSHKAAVFGYLYSFTAPVTLSSVR